MKAKHLKVAKINKQCNVTSTMYLVHTVARFFANQCRNGAKTAKIQVGKVDFPPAFSLQKEFVSILASMSRDAKRTSFRHSYNPSQKQEREPQLNENSHGKS